VLNGTARGACVLVLLVVKRLQRHPRPHPHPRHHPPWCAGPDASRWDRSVGGGGRYIDRALAAARRAAALEPAAPAICNHIAGLLARGAAPGAIVATDGGRFLRNHTATAASTASKASAAVRNQRVHNQLVRCLMVEADLLRIVYSKDALVATTTELRRTSDALRTLANKRLDIFYTAGARAHDGHTFSQPATADEGDGVDDVSTNSTVVKYLPDPAKYSHVPADNLMSEVYGHTAMAFRKAKGLSVEHIVKAMKGSQQGGPMPPPAGSVRGY